MAFNILIADDSIVARTVIIKTLKLCNLEIGELHQAVNGKQALELLEKRWIDLAFLDINMPIMNGEEVVEAIRANPIWKDLPVVVISTEGSETRIDHLLEMGVKFIHKPFPPESIRNAIRSFFGDPHEHRI